MSDVLRVMTFNIRNSGAGDGVNAWPNRRELWTRVVRSFDPDLLGVQEVLADQHDFLIDRFADYGTAGVAREDGYRKGEWSMILYRQSRFALLDTGNFWLSETPDVIGSRSWDTACCRLCSWVKLRDRQNDRILIQANAHLDHVGVRARQQSAELLQQKLSVIGDDAAVVLTGDFNCTEVDEPYRILTRWLTDSFRQVHPIADPNEASFHNFCGATLGRRIDWILHTHQFKAVAATIDRTRGPNGRCPSDHDAVIAGLQWNTDAFDTADRHG